MGHSINKTWLFHIVVPKNRVSICCQTYPKRLKYYMGNFTFNTDPVWIAATIFNCGLKNVQNIFFEQQQYCRSYLNDVWPPVTTLSTRTRFHYISQAFLQLINLRPLAAFSKAVQPTETAHLSGRETAILGILRVDGPIILREKGWLFVGILAV